MREEKIQAYWKLKPAVKFPHLASIPVRRDAVDGNLSTSIEIELGRNSAPNGERLRFRAFGIANLRLRDPNLGCLVVLDVTDVSSYQLERLNYRVFNTEQDAAISFDCYDFDFWTVTPESPIR